MDEKSAGQVGYEAYGEAVGWVAISGAPMPMWKDLPWRIQHAWECAAVAAQGILQPLTSRQLEVIYVATSGSIGWRYEEGQSVFYDISGRQITQAEYNQVMGELHRVYRHA